MPVITHSLRAVFAYPFYIKLWDKHAKYLSLTEWKKKVTN